jgi:hypothetical protein
MCLLFSALFAVAGTVHAQTSRLSDRSGGTTSLRTGNSGMNVSQQREEVRKEPEKRVGSVTKMTFTGPPTGWGVAKASTPFYSAEGRRLGEISGGTLFTYSSVKTSSKNMVLEAKVKRDDAWDGPFFIDISELVIFGGVLDEMPQGLVSNIQTYYSAKSQIAQRRQSIEETEYARNPHFESAKLANEKYVESMKTAQVLSARADKEVGLTKNKTLDQLRALKYEQVRIKAAADKEAASYKAWKEANPVSPEKFASDKELVALETQLREVKVKVAHVLPEE